MLPGGEPLTALVNGYHSWSANRVVTLPLAGGRREASHGVLGLTRGRRGLALAFDPGEPGEAAVHLGRPRSKRGPTGCPPRPRPPRRRRRDAAYRVRSRGRRHLRPGAAARPGPADQDRFAAAAPAGWCSWYELYDKVTEADVIANLEVCAARFDRRFLRTIQIDDGYQRAAGDWDVNAKFPHGHRWLTDRIHEQRLSGRPVDRAIRRDGGIGDSGRASRLASRRTGSAAGAVGQPELGRPGVRARRRPSRSASMARRPGAPCRAGVGLRLPEDRFPVVRARGAIPIGAARHTPRRTEPVSGRSARDWGRTPSCWAAARRCSTPWAW